MRLHQLLGIAVVAAGCLAVPAYADLTVYYHAGGWDAFDGQDGQGPPFCGIGTRNPTDGRTFSLRFPVGGNDVIFIATKPGWNIPDRTTIPVVMQVGLDQPWTEQGIGGGRRVEWAMSRADAQTFDAQFRRASSMTVTFPSGNEAPWTVSLAGSTAISNVMARCVTDMTQRISMPPSAPPPESATQPFRAAPPAPATPGGGAAAPQVGQPPQTQPNSQPGSPAGASPSATPSR